MAAAGGGGDREGVGGGQMEKRAQGEADEGRERRLVALCGWEVWPGDGKRQPGSAPQPLASAPSPGWVSLTPP